MVNSFNSFLSEQSPDKPYRFVVIYNDPENMTDDSKREAEEMAVNMLKYGKELGLVGFKCRIEDAYLTRKDDKIFRNDVEVTENAN